MLVKTMKTVIVNYHCLSHYIILLPTRVRVMVLQVSSVVPSHRTPPRGPTIKIAPPLLGTIAVLI